MGKLSPLRKALADFRADAGRYVYYDNPEASPTWSRYLRSFAAHQGLQAVALHRFAQFLREDRSRGPVAALRVAGKVLYPILSRMNDMLTGICISRDAHIGPGLFIAHYNGVMIGSSYIGANCNIGNNVTIGKGGRGDRNGLPVIGDRVVIAVGACVLGQVTVGDDAMVGANSLVVRDVEPRAVMSGVPAQQISSRGSFEYLEYRDMGRDAARVRSMAAVARPASAPVGLAAGRV